MKQKTIFIPEMNDTVFMTDIGKKGTIKGLDDRTVIIEQDESETADYQIIQKPINDLVWDNSDKCFYV